MRSMPRQSAKRPSMRFVAAKSEAQQAAGPTLTIAKAPVFNRKFFSLFVNESDGQGGSDDLPRDSKKILIPLETKNDFAIFFVATGGWRPGASWAWANETGTGRVRCW